jgi:hypothetical protein
MPAVTSTILAQSHALASHADKVQSTQRKNLALAPYLQPVQCSPAGGRLGVHQAAPDNAADGNCHTAGSTTTWLYIMHSEWCLALHCNRGIAQHSDYASCLLVLLGAAISTGSMHQQQKQCFAVRCLRLHPHLPQPADSFID